MIAAEGYSTIVACAVASAIAIALSAWFVMPVVPIVVGVAVVLNAFVLWFFRDPRRMPPADPDGRSVVAPADGRVLEIADEEDRIYAKGPVKRVSIFLSPLNVHVNRVPTGGVVEFVRYVPGEYLVAWHPKSSEKNERSEIGVRHPHGHRVLFKQIAGAVARRIVFHLTEGDVVTLGQRFGIVKFGSRMDVLLPPTSTIEVSVDDRVVAGESLLATLPRREER